HTFIMAAVGRPAERIGIGALAYFSGGPLFRNGSLLPPSWGYPTSSLNFVTPCAHGRHAKFCSILWFDGHVKGMRPVLPTADIRTNTVAQYQQFEIGDVMRGARTMNAVIDDHFFLPTH